MRQVESDAGGRKREDVPVVLGFAPPPKPPNPPVVPVFVLLVWPKPPPKPPPPNDMAAMIRWGKSIQVCSNDPKVGDVGTKRVQRVVDVCCETQNLDGSRHGGGSVKVETA